VHARVGPLVFRRQDVQLFGAQALILAVDREKNHVTLSTKALEPRCGAWPHGVPVQCRVSISLPPACSPGHMLRDKQLMFSKAEETGAAFVARTAEPPAGKTQP
jgi:hypothetical protein